MKLQRFVVIVQQGNMQRAVGPYRSFKRAIQDATGWQTDGREPLVIPLVSIADETTGGALVKHERSRA